MFEHLLDTMQHVRSSAGPAVLNLHDTSHYTLHITQTDGWNVQNVNYVFYGWARKPDT